MPKPSCKAQWKGEEDKADKGRGGKTTSRNGQAWNSARGQWRTEKWRKLVAKSSVVPQRPSWLRDGWWWWWWLTSEIRECIFRANCMLSFQFMQDVKHLMRRSPLLFVKQQNTPHLPFQLLKHDLLCASIIFEVLKEVAASQELGYSMWLYVLYIPA